MYVSVCKLHIICEVFLCVPPPDTYIYTYICVCLSLSLSLYIYICVCVCVCVCVWERNVLYGYCQRKWTWLVEPSANPGRGRLLMPFGRACTHLFSPDPSMSRVIMLAGFSSLNCATDFGEGKILQHYNLWSLLSLLVIIDADDFGFFI